MPLLFRSNDYIHNSKKNNKKFISDATLFKVDSKSCELENSFLDTKVISEGSAKKADILDYSNDRLKNQTKKETFTKHNKKFNKAIDAYANETLDSLCISKIGSFSSCIVKDNENNQKAKRSREKKNEKIEQMKKFIEKSIASPVLESPVKEIKTFFNEIQPKTIEFKRDKEIINNEISETNHTPNESFHTEKSSDNYRGKFLNN